MLEVTKPACDFILSTITPALFKVMRILNRTGGDANCLTGTSKLYLPPIKDPILLMPTHLLAKRIQKRHSTSGSKFLWFASSNKLHGTTNNPFDSSRVPSVSSDGEEALVADCSSPLSICSDIGENDHRKIGAEYDLFFFHELSPGNCFFKPDGAHIYDTLVDFLRKEYRKRGLKVVKSPNIFKDKLWKISGHWDHYADKMFHIEGKDNLSLKPMNCPGHCLIYKQKTVSWRDLPLRYADFGALHRNESSGCLTGLTRVRRFQQDDAHIFCAPEQIKGEISETLDFVDSVYKKFGFNYELSLSTRPKSYLGGIDLWNQAEDALRQVLDATGNKWKVEDGDGAFYGPKIDITLTDALHRPHQCATIQLDFQLPIRFDLSYHCQDGSKQRPVMVHRAIFGSVERFMAILTENFGGNWPFWLSPRQAQIAPLATAFDSYAISVRSKLYEAGFEVALNLDPSKTLSKKVKMAWLNRYSFILVVGEKESQSNSVTVRTRANKVYKEVPIDILIELFEKFKEEHTLDSTSLFDELMGPRLKNLE